MPKTAPAPALATPQKVWRAVVIVSFLAVVASMVAVVPAKDGHGELSPDVGIPITIGATILTVMALLLAHFLPAAYLGANESEGARERTMTYAAAFWGLIFAVGIVVALRVFIIAVDDPTDYSDDEMLTWFACTALNVLLLASHGIRATLELKKR